MSLDAPRQLTDLPVATEVNSTDIFLMRQSLLDKQISASILFGNLLKSSNNLSDLANAAVARTNLGVSATSDVLLKANNLSDVLSANSARINLGLAIGTNVQSWSAELDSLAANHSTLGLICQTASNTVASRTLIPPAAGMTISNPTGAGGNPTFAFSNDLAAVEGIASIGLAVRMASDTWTTRLITANPTYFNVTNPDGVLGNPYIDFIPSAPSITDIAHGGTGQTTKQAGFNALSPLSAQGDLLIYDGSNNIRLPAGTPNYLLQTQGPSANPLYVSPGAIGGHVLLGYFSVIGGALEIRNINQLVKNCGSRISSLVVAFNPTNWGGYSNFRVYMQLGYTLPIGGIIPNPATPTYMTSNYYWKGDYAAGNQDIGWDLMSGLTVDTAQTQPANLGTTYYQGTYEIKCGGQDKRVSGSITSGSYFGMNGTFSCFDSGFVFRAGAIGGVITNATYVSPYYNVSTFLTAIKIFSPTAQLNGGSIQTPNDVNGITGSTCFTNNCVALYGKVF